MCELGTLDSVRVTLCDVGPRDGLQNEPEVLAPPLRAELVDRLAAAGLVERQACPTDRRSTYAALTTIGADRILAALPLHVAYLVEVFEAVFTAEELELYSGLTRRLRDAVNPCAAKASDPGGLGDPG